MAPTTTARTGPTKGPRRAAERIGSMGGLPVNLRVHASRPRRQPDGRGAHTSDEGRQAQLQVARGPHDERMGPYRSSRALPPRPANASRPSNPSSATRSRPKISRSKRPRYRPTSRSSSGWKRTFSAPSRASRGRRPFPELGTRSRPKRMPRSRARLPRRSRFTIG